MKVDLLSSSAVLFSFVLFVHAGRDILRLPETQYDRVVPCRLKRLAAAVCIPCHSIPFPIRSVQKYSCCLQGSPIIFLCVLGAVPKASDVLSGKHQQAIASGHPTHGGAIAGAVIGGVAAVVLAALAVMAYAYSRRRGCDSKLLL